MTGFPDIDKWVLGNQLRDIRIRLGLTLAQVGGRLDWSAPRVLRWETGDWKRQSRSELLSLLDVYDITGERRVQMIELFSEAKKRGQTTNDATNDLDVFAMFEERCTSLRTYQTSVVHGLLQSPGYARHLFSLHRPDEENDDPVRQRLARGERFFARSPAPMITVVMNTSVTQMAHTHPEVWYEQVDHIVELMRRHPNLAVHLVEGHPVPSGPFTIWSLRDPKAWTVAYSSGGLTRQFSYEQSVIDTLDDRWSRLLGAAASTPTTIQRLKEQR